MLYGMDEEKPTCCKEAEDFMCDQIIFSTEVDFEAKPSSQYVSTTKLRLAVEIIANSLLPTISTVYYAYMRNQRCVVDSVRKIVIPTVLAVLANYLSQSLSTVHRRISSPAIDAGHQQVAASAGHARLCDVPEACVSCDVLNAPTNVRVDVIFIHGLHGALDKTWKQGCWRHERHKVNRQELTRSPSLASKAMTLKRPLQSSHAPAYVQRNKISKRSINQSIINSGCPTETCSAGSCSKDGCTCSLDMQPEKPEHAHPCWPLWLNEDCPGARLIALNYTTDPHLWRPIWVKKRNRTGMVERSKEMIGHLQQIGVGEYPIVWVGHSKGGLYIKQMLIDCAACNDHDAARMIYSQTKAILFYSVPHRGSIMADFTLPLLSKSVELTEVQKNCKFVLELHNKFLKLFNDDVAFAPEVFSFIETSFTLMSFIYLKIVSFESADPGIGEICGVPLDHREICKPAGRDCFLYKELVRLIGNALRKRESFSSNRCDNRHVID